MKPTTTRPVLFTVEIICPEGAGQTHTMRARVQWDEICGFNDEAIERAIERAVQKARPGKRNGWHPDLGISPDRYLLCPQSQPGEKRTQYGHICHTVAGGTSLDQYARIDAEVL